MNGLIPLDCDRRSDLFTRGSKWSQSQRDVSPLLEETERAGFMSSMFSLDIAYPEAAKRAIEGDSPHHDLTDVSTGEHVARRRQYRLLRE
mmetsp:Transcript_36706/g.117760  ORF Transcript_36706/g.117760 Transcript_36706/m.117760 type:complete len:90 (-) Transcript_36706:282-551(-)